MTYLQHISINRRPHNNFRIRSLFLVFVLGVIMFLSKTGLAIGGDLLISHDDGEIAIRNLNVVNCTSKQIEVENTCVDCNSTQYVSNNTCFECDERCQTCEFDGSNCLSCDDGFYLSGPNNNVNSSNPNASYNLTCLPCDSTCDKCFGTSSNCTDQILIPDFIGSCSASGSRLLCQTYCLACNCQNLQTKCLKPQQGYTVDSNGKIKKCIQGCETCLASDLTKCQKCFSSYSLSSDKSSCNVCDPTCASCNSTGCSTCIQGQFVNSSKCQACSVGNCANCDGDGSLCNTCKDGYLITKDRKRCTGCLPSCSKCDQSNIFNCLGCIAGFFKDGSECKPCPSGCMTCSSATTCTQCFTGFRKSNGQNTQECVKNCQFPCLKCSDLDPTYCLGSCPLGYKYNRGECENDLSCNQAANCSVCPKGYRLQGSSCTPCSVTSCSECSTSVNSCSSCLYGYFLSDNVCKKCANGCVSCYDEKVCYSCESGYTISTNNKKAEKSSFCVKCKKSCKTCSIKANQCTSCASEHILVGWKCIPKENIGYILTLNDDRNPSTYANEEAYLPNIDTIIDTLSLEDQDDHTLTTIIQGSIIQSGIVTSPKASQCEKFAAIANALSVGSFINGKQILASSLTPSNSACIANNSANVSLAIILSVSLSLLALLILGLLIFVIFSNNSTQQPQMEEDDQLGKKDDGLGTQSQIGHSNNGMQMY